MVTMADSISPDTVTSAARVPEGGAADPQAPRMRAWRAFLYAHAAVMRELEAQLVAERGMTLAEYDALVQLASAPGARLRMSDLAARVLLSRSGVTRLVDRLERQGLVRRESCGSDARGAFAALTPAGVHRLREADAGAPARHRPGLRRRDRRRGCAGGRAGHGEPWQRRRAIPSRGTVRDRDVPPSVTRRMPEALTIGQVLDDAFEAYEGLAELAESIEDEWTYVTDVSAAWRERLRGGRRGAGRRARRGAGAGGRRAGHR